MAERSDPRLGAAHLDDLAIVILTTPSGAEAPVRPELDEEGRARLRSRLKLIGRHDWPSNLREDPALRRGYTLRQCFRLMTGLLLLDAHIPPSVAIHIARANELQLLRTITARLTLPVPTDHDHPIVVVLLGQFWEWLDQKAWNKIEPFRIRMTTKAELAELWSSDRDFGVAGQRLLIDISGAARIMWDWVRARDLLPVSALEELVDQLGKQASETEYQPIRGISKRR